MNIYGQWMMFDDGNDFLQESYHFQFEHNTELRQLIARKLSDKKGFVPAGEVSFFVNLDNMQCEVCVAEQGFKQPKFIPALLKVINRDQMFIFVDRFIPSRIVRFSI